jgi:hypothetical protein
MQESVLARFRERVGASVDPNLTPARGFVTFERTAWFVEPLEQPVTLPGLVALTEEGFFHSGTDPRWIGGAAGKRLWRTF